MHLPLVMVTMVGMEHATMNVIIHSLVGMETAWTITKHSNAAQIVAAVEVVVERRELLAEDLLQLQQRVREIAVVHIMREVTQNAKKTPRHVKVSIDLDYALVVQLEDVAQMQE